MLTKGHTYLNLQLKVASLFKYSTFCYHQALKGSKNFIILGLGTKNCWEYLFSVNINLSLSTDLLTFTEEIFKGHFPFFMLRWFFYPPLDLVIKWNKVESWQRKISQNSEKSKALHLFNFDYKIIYILQCKIFMP